MRTETSGGSSQIWFSNAEPLAHLQTPLSGSVGVNHGFAPIDGVDLSPAHQLNQRIIFPGPNPWDPHRNLKEFRAEAAAAPRHIALGSDTDVSTVDAKLAELNRTLTEKRDHAAGIVSQPGVDTDRKRFFSDMQGAMQDDLAALQGSQRMSREQKIDLYNRIAHEAEIEIKYNVNVGRFDKDWTQDELTQMDAALARIPDRLLLEDRTLNKILRFGSDDVYHRAGGHNSENGSIGIYDAAFGKSSQFPGGANQGFSSFADTLIHEVGHGLAEHNPRYDDYLKISGWHKVDPALLAGRVNNSEVKGSDVGITDDPDGIYIIAKESGQGAFVRRKDAEFGHSDYGKTNPADDYCETLAEFLLDPEALRAKAPEKYQFMVEFAGQGYSQPQFPKLDLSSLWPLSSGLNIRA
jgi:hypothetical protein